MDSIPWAKLVRTCRPRIRCAVCWYNHIHLPVMPAQAVVVVRHQAAAPAAERNAAVFIVQAGLILIDQILRSRGNHSRFHSSGWLPS
jgi:hypothetical protein